MSSIFSRAISGSKSPARARVAHVAEDVERIGGQIRGKLVRDERCVGQKAQVARHAVLLKVRDASCRAA